MSQNLCECVSALDHLPPCWMPPTPLPLRFSVCGNDCAIWRVEKPSLGWEPYVWTQEKQEVEGEAVGSRRWKRSCNNVESVERSWGGGKGERIRKRLRFAVAWVEVWGCERPFTHSGFLLQSGHQEQMKESRVKTVMGFMSRWWQNSL